MVLTYYDEPEVLGVEARYVQREERVADSKDKQK